MPLAPAIAAALNVGLPTRTKALWINGLDVLKEPGTPGNRPGVPIESIELTEAPPGQVSRLSFTIEDPTGAWSFAAGNVVYQDLTRDVPLFRGFIDDIAPGVLGVGRSIDMTCTGVEAVLDWMYVPAATSWAGGVTDLDLATAVQKLVAAAIPVGFPLNVNANYSYFAGFGSGSGIGTPIRADMVLWGTSILAGTAGPGTLRQCLDTLSATVVDGLSNAVGVGVSVDFYGGLRIARTLADGSLAGDIYAPLAVGPASTVAARPRHRVSYGDAPAQVYVSSSTPAGVGLVTAGDGRIGPLARITDNNATDASSRDRIGRQYLARRGVAAQGDFDLEERVTVDAGGGVQYHPGSQLTITDASLGLSSFTAPMGTVVKRFLSNGAELWHVEYGTRVRSAVAVLRRLTRDQSLA